MDIDGLSRNVYMLKGVVNMFECEKFYVKVVVVDIVLKNDIVMIDI